MLKRKTRRKSPLRTPTIVKIRISIRNPAIAQIHGKDDQNESTIITGTSVAFTAINTLCVTPPGVAGWQRGRPVTGGVAGATESRDHSSGLHAERCSVDRLLHNRLGAINRTLLTLESIERAGLTCAGLVINEFGEQENTAFSTNVSILEELTTVPILFHLHEGQRTLDLALA